jgi:hypothetical protein
MAIIFCFPSKVFSGHEKMAIKIIDNAPVPVHLLINKELLEKFNHTNRIKSFNGILNLAIIFLRLRLTNRKIKIFLIAGSPLGFIREKLLIKIFFFDLIEYVPVPEMKQIYDRTHHKLMPLINRLLIDTRILIDYWQIEYSSVKKCLVIRNLIEND